MGKSIIIIGAGPGLSRAVAEKFGQNGYFVGLISRNEQKLKKMATDLNSKKIQTFYYKADAYDRAQLEKALNKLSLKFGGVSVLFYNVAPGRKKDLFQETVPDLIDDFRLTVGHGLFATQLLYDDLKASAGSVLFTGSGFAGFPRHEFGSLSLSKAGIRSLAKQLYTALKPDGIYVGTLTIRGYIEAGSKTHSPEILAEKFWEMHQERSRPEVTI